MSNNYEHKLIMKCIETDEYELVNLVEFVPRVTLTIDFMPGSRHYRRIQLQYNSKTDDYRTEVYGRNFSSKGPKVHSTKKYENNRVFNKKTTQKYF